MQSGDCPVIIDGAILRLDNEKGRYVAQAQLRNLGVKRITSLKLNVNAFAANGAVIMGVQDYVYGGFIAAQGEIFGQSAGILMPDGKVRSISLYITEVIFEDGTAWIPGVSVNYAEPQPIPAQVKEEKPRLQSRGKCGIAFGILSVIILFFAIIMQIVNTAVIFAEAPMDIFTTQLSVMLNNNLLSWVIALILPVIAIISSFKDFGPKANRVLMIVNLAFIGVNFLVSLIACILVFSGQPTVPFLYKFNGVQFCNSIYIFIRGGFGASTILNLIVGILYILKNVFSMIVFAKRARK